MPEISTSNAATAWARRELRMIELNAASSGSVATGIPGLDDILAGGLTANRIYLIEGNPGSGKTTLALRWLMEGEQRGEKGIYVTLSETKIELGDVARSRRFRRQQR